MSEMIWWSSIIVVPMILPLYRCMQGLKSISYFMYSKVPMQVILENAVLLVLFVEKVANARWSWRCFRRPSYWLPYLGFRFGQSGTLSTLGGFGGGLERY